MQNYEEYEMYNLDDEVATLRMYDDGHTEVTFPDGTTLTYGSYDKAVRILKKNGFRF